MVVGDAVRTGTFSDRCHLAPYASARSAIHKNTIRTSTSCFLLEWKCSGVLADVFQSKQ